MLEAAERDESSCTVPLSITRECSRSSGSEK